MFLLKNLKDLKGSYFFLSSFINTSYCKLPLQDIYTQCGFLANNKDARTRVWILIRVNKNVFVKDLGQISRITLAFQLSHTFKANYNNTGLTSWLFAKIKVRHYNNTDDVYCYLCFSFWLQSTYNSRDFYC